MSQLYSYRYPRPALTADCVVYGFDGHLLHILLIQRGIEPYKGQWALPGGFMNMKESIEECAARELREETGISGITLRQFHTFSSVDRDPRGRVVTVAFLGLLNKSQYRIAAGDDAAHTEWWPVNLLPPLAFDHAQIIARSMQALRTIAATEPAVLELVDKTFTIAELQRLAELITGEEYDRRNFQRRLLQSNMLEPRGNDPESTGARPATLYTLKEEPDMQPPAPTMPTPTPCCCEPEADNDCDAAAFMASRKTSKSRNSKKWDWFKFCISILIH